MNFQELIKNKTEKLDFPFVETYILGASVARNAIMDLLLKVNDGNYNAHGEHINQSCREEAETIERIMHLIKYGNEYED